MGRILVTGGAGFLGAKLCRFLLNKLGHEVVCVDDMSSGTLENIVDIFENPRFIFYKNDVARFPYEECDRIYHLACPASPVFYYKDSIQTINTCFNGSLNMLRIAEDVGARILLASTSEVYGDPLETPQKESYRGNVDPYCERSCYDEGKRAAETLFYLFKEKRGVDARVVRIFNSYGPGMRADDGRVVSNFICQALKGEPITIYGDGCQTRSFCYCDDTIYGLVATMETNEPAYDGAPVNIGAPNEITMNALADLIREMCGSRSPVVHKELPKNDPKRRVPDIERAKSVLHWGPQWTLEEGLEKTIEYFRKKLNVFE